MSKPKFPTSLMLLVLSILVFPSAASAQNNLTAKANSVQPVAPTADSDRVKDGLAGPVRRVRTEVAKLSMANGKPVEDKHVVLETASYDIKGGKTENQYFPVAGSALTGKEVYKYDQKGNISEMTLLNSDGSLLGKEVYKYDYDSIGNWTRMTTSVAVVEGGKVTFEPSEVTYRSIMYYLDENMLKLAQPVASSINAEAGAAAPKPAKVESKPQPDSPSENKSQAVNKSAGNQGVAANNKTVLTLPAVNSTMSKSNAGSSSVLSSNNTAPTSAKGTVVELESEPPPAVPLPKPLLKPVSGGVLNGKAVTLPTPTYPDAARRMRTGGLVTIEVVVDENGKVISAQATSGPAILREVALQAALKARFSPTMLSGQPVKVTGVINYKFSLSQ
jgi:TonB family protein